MLKINENEYRTLSKEYLNLSLPSGFECIIVVLISMTDTFMISKFGSKIIAAVGAMGTVIDFMYLVLQSITVSNNVMVARLLGKKEEQKAKRTTGNALIIAMFSSLLCILIVLSISKFLPNLFLIDKTGLTYLYIRLVAVIPTTILTILSGYQRTLGNSMRMLNIRIVCFVINAVLDFIFVYLGLGVSGVAISTVVVEFVSMFILIYYSKNIIEVKFDKNIIKEQLNLIKYNVYERFFKRGSNFILNIIISRIGTFQYAAHLIVMQFIDLVNNFLYGVGIGTQTMIGVAIGSDDNKKINVTSNVINKINKKMVFMITFIIGVFMILSLSCFLVDKESLIIGYKLLIFVLFDCILSGFYHYYSSILRAEKEFKYISKLSLIISAFLKVILAYLFNKAIGIYGIWTSFIISDAIMDKLLNNRINVIKGDPHHIINIK